MSYDILIQNGTVVDGTGAPRYQADVAVAAGKIVEIGKIRAGASRVIDAAGLIVAPGFIDPHTHYDAQICWDSLCTCSSWHGVTSVVAGNCGVGLAPCRPELQEVMTWDLVNVEGMSFDVLCKGVTWEWGSFSDFMTAAERRGLGINVGFLAPLTPFRHCVMGEESMERAATPEELKKIRFLLREAIEAGALGFSTTTISQHIGYQGRPLACRLASREELKACANVLQESRRGVIEVALTESPGMLSDSEYELLSALLTESGRPVTWGGVINRDDKPEATFETLHKAEPLVKRGGIPQTSCRPLVTEIDLHQSFFIFAHLHSWKRAFNQPVDVQKRLYCDPAFRQEFRKELETPRIFSGRWERVEVKEVNSPILKSLEGRTVAEIAEERGKDGLETFLDIALEDELHTKYLIALFNADEERIPALITDPRVLIAASDGGAHVDMLCDAGYCTYLLGTWVRDKHVMMLERAIQRLTAEPASLFGLQDRGKLAVGMAADIVIFDYNTVGSGKRPEMCNDLPGGGRRLVMQAQGIQYTIVNGQILYEDRTYTGVLPGRVLHSWKG